MKKGCKICSPFLYEINKQKINKICSSSLMKVCVTSKQGLVTATEVINDFNSDDFSEDMPEWVKAWIEAGRQRPWL